MDQDQQLIRAAGGLLWKYAGGEWRLAVVRLRRRGDEWTLPKGKLKDNESFLEAAKREVSEETGCKVDVRAFRSTLWYPSNGVQKIVLLWDMRLIKEGKFEANDEIDAVDWWPPARAREKLVHARERDVIPDAPELSVEPISLPNGQASGRLAQSISCFALELEALIKASRERGDDPWIWASTAREHLHLATQSLAGDLDEGWLHFNASQRWALHGLSDAELAVKERALIEEANHKLGSWRQQLVLRALEPNGARADERRAAIFHAAKARDEYHQNQHRRRRVVRSQLALLGAIIVAVISAIAVFAALGRQLPVAVLFGALGAAFSAMRDLTGRAEVAPERSMTLARVAVGAAAGLVVHTVIRAGILPLTIDSSAAASVLAFAAGFCERLVLRLVPKRT